MTFKYTPKYDLIKLLDAKASKIKPPFTWYTLIATWFYVGMIGFMPGTFGSIASYPLYYVCVYGSESANNAMMRFWMVLIPLFFISWIAIKKFEQKTFTHDNKSIVVDEVLGMLLCFALCFDQAYLLAQTLKPYFSIKPVNLAFIIVLIVFRYFDITKPLFIKYIDKKMRTALSVILDDLVAALFTVAVISIAQMILAKVL